MANQSVRWSQKEFQSHYVRNHLVRGKRVWESERGVAWGTSMAAPGLGVMKPYDGQPATRGNGTMVALVVDSPAKVDALYAKALSLGATDEGASGPRGIPGFYAGYFRDPDGNKLNFYCFT